MLVKLDENLSLSHLKLITDFGHTAERVTDERLSGATDETIWEHACAEGRFLITLDLDFSDVRRYSPGTHPGILLLRPRNTGRTAVRDVLSHVMHEHGWRRWQAVLL
jgi:predicted nuclease of predicted toxin-antitoxin system